MVRLSVCTDTLEGSTCHECVAEWRPACADPAVSECVDHDPGRWCLRRLEAELLIWPGVTTRPSNAGVVVDGCPNHETVRPATSDKGETKAGLSSSTIALLPYIAWFSDQGCQAWNCPDICLAFFCRDGSNLQEYSCIWADNFGSIWLADSGSSLITVDWNYFFRFIFTLFIAFVIIKEDS